MKVRRQLVQKNLIRFPIRGKIIYLCKSNVRNHKIQVTQKPFPPIYRILFKAHGSKLSLSQFVTWDKLVKLLYSIFCFTESHFTILKTMIHAVKKLFQPQHHIGQNNSVLLCILLSPPCNNKTHLRGINAVPVINKALNLSAALL